MTTSVDWISTDVEVPRDRAEVLVINIEGAPVMQGCGFWHEGEWHLPAWWCGIKPTHWRPYPSPPLAGAEESEPETLDEMVMRCQRVMNGCTATVAEASANFERVLRAMAR